MLSFKTSSFATLLRSVPAEAHGVGSDAEVGLHQAGRDQNPGILPGLPGGLHLDEDRDSGAGGHQAGHDNGARLGGLEACLADGGGVENFLINQPKRACKFLIFIIK